MSRNKTALLLGAYGQTNLGDDLLMYNYVRLLSSKGYARIRVNISEARHVPKPITNAFPHLEIFETYHTSAFKLLNLMRTSDAIVYGGGTVYKELYATTGRSRYSVIANVMLFNVLAALFGKKIYGCHIGIGSVKTALGRAISWAALRWCDRTTFRDEVSYRYARDTLKLPTKRIAHSTDGLFIDTVWQKEWNHATVPIPKRLQGTVVAINVLHDIPDWIDRNQYISSIRTCAAKLMDEGNYIVFLPFQNAYNPHDDLTFLRQEILSGLKGYHAYHVVEDLSIDTVISYLKQVDVLIGMRFHSLLLAAVAGTPFLALAYDTKCWRFVQEAGYGHALKLEDVTAATLYDSYQALLKDMPVVRKRLRAIAKANYETAKEWLANTAF
jgi:polysaccharide pyruvyl transferase WcaK-like protein